MTIPANQLIIFDNVSKFYGEILGVNRVNLQIAPGITSLVGPNGAGKSTLMNLMTGLLRPTRGKISLLGIPTDQPRIAKSPLTAKACGSAFVWPRRSLMSR
jgi:ABC-2 type transport system ATP-binding protein